MSSVSERFAEDLRLAQGLAEDLAQYFAELADVAADVAPDNPAAARADLLVLAEAAKRIVVRLTALRAANTPP